MVWAEMVWAVMVMGRNGHGAKKNKYNGHNWLWAEGGKRLGEKRLGCETTRGGIGLGAKRPGFQWNLINHLMTGARSVQFF